MELQLQYNTNTPVGPIKSVSDSAVIATDLFAIPVAKAADLASNSGLVDPIMIDPNSSLPVDTTATGDQTAALPTDISVDPIMIDPTLVDPNSGLLIEIVVAPIDIVPVDFIWPTDWSVDSSNALLTFNDITIADPILAIGSFEPILPPAVFDPSSVVISDNTATDVPSVSLIGVPDISVQTF